MLVNDKLVLVTTPKTGWTFSKDYIKENFPGARFVHKYVKDLSKEDFKKFKFGIVRNPWDYYVSWFHYHKAQNGVWFKAIMQDKDKTFRNFIITLNDFNGHKLGESISWDLDKHLVTNGFKIQNEAVGLYSLLYLSSFSKKSIDLIIKQQLSLNEIIDQYNDIIDVNHFCKTETLNQDLYHALTAAGYTFTDQKKKALLNAPKVNKSNHTLYTEYYDDELVDLVANLDRLIIQKHNYKFGE